MNDIAAAGGVSWPSQAAARPWMRATDVAAPFFLRPQHSLAPPSVLPQGAGIGGGGASPPTRQCRKCMAERRSPSFPPHASTLSTARLRRPAPCVLVRLVDQDKSGACNEQDIMNKHILLLTFIDLRCSLPFREVLLLTSKKWRLQSGCNHSTAYVDQWKG